MKLKPLTRSAFFSLRALAALTLCILGCFLALGAVGAVPTPFTKALIESKTRFAAANSPVDSRYAETVLAKMKAFALRRDASKAIVSRAPAGSRAPAQSSPVSNQSIGISEHRNQLGQIVYSIPASRFDISPPLTELAKTEVPARPPQQERPEHEFPEWRIPRSEKPDPVVQVVPSSDQARDVVAPNAPDAIAAAASGFNFDGISGFSLDNGYPPDENGSVGYDPATGVSQFVEMVNSHYQVWSLNRATRVATSIIPKTEISTLFAGFGGACQTRNDGDPVVLYDKVANRWLLSQFTSAAVSGVYYQCVAISTTPNAAGTYFRYAFPVPNGLFGDYPHYGVWNDAYYVMEHHFDANSSFSSAGFGAMDRTKMLAGDSSATWQVILDPLEGGHMPADLDGFAPPPAGAPGIFTSLHGEEMFLYRMKVDFSNAANTTRTVQAQIPIAPHTAACNGGQCIPQPNSPFPLDSLGGRLMFRLAYRNFIDHESLVVSHSVDPGVAGVVSGVRWYEFRISGQPDAVCSSYPCTYQQGTIADAPNGRARWMPSVAQDGAGNMLAGYTATGTLEPIDAHSIRYTGRAANHPLGTMTVPEGIIQTGNRNIVSDGPTRPVGLGRWGDYSSMSVDPADDCTFWYVGEFYRQGQGSNTPFDWSTKVASVAFSPAQCQPTTCTTRPASAPTGASASAIAPNQIQVTWNPILPVPGSYAIERANGAPGSEGLYQPLAFVSGASTSYVDNTVQGGLTYSYRVIAATDAGGRCQALVRSGVASATATGGCNFKPSFAGAISASSIDGPACGIALAWAPGVSNCPLTPTVKYNVYRGTTPDFVPSSANRVASCIPGPSSYVDTAGLTSGNTYFYVVRAEDNSTGHGGSCGGGNEDTNNIHVAGTAFGSSIQATPSALFDGGGDFTSFLRLNAPGLGNTADPAWRFVSSGNDPGANHTLPNGDYAYRNAGPAPTAIYDSNQCAAAETPVLTVGATSMNLRYYERHQLEKGWDGVAIEYSRNGGPWTDVPPPSNATADGCDSSDSTADYAALECTQANGAGTPVLNACGYPTTKMVITGPNIVANPVPLPTCDTYMTAEITNYARRCHRLNNLVVGDTIQFRWRFTSDPGAEFKGFYLDDIEVTNVRLPEACTTAVPGIPVLTGAASRKIHNGVPFDVSMPLNGSGVEPRTSSGTNTIVLHFDRPMQSGTATASPGTAGALTPSGNDMLLDLSGVPNQQRVTLTLTNLVAVGGGVLNSASIQIGFLFGDVNASRRVDSADITSVRQQSLKPLVEGNFRNDVNVSGRIDGRDGTAVAPEAQALRTLP